MVGANIECTLTHLAAETVSAACELPSVGSYSISKQRSSTYLSPSVLITDLNLMHKHPQALSIEKSGVG